jgi:serine protein kinase
MAEPTFVQAAGQRHKAAWVASRSVLSFDEYLDLVAAKPVHQVRNAARYVVDAIHHFGADELQRVTGTRRRYRLFDAPFDEGRGRVAGQEQVQEGIVRALENFVRAGRVDRLVLLHGPNGSAKTSLIQVLSRATEVYSHHEDGALYRFNWVFPTGATQRGRLGFDGASSKTTGSYAHLDGNNIESRIPCELRDHPLLLLPRIERLRFFSSLAMPPDITIPDVLRQGELSAKNRKIFDALLTAHHGDMTEVLRHVQVERFYLSRRYRTGITAVEPQMAVDAYARQVTADRSMGMLPTTLQHVALYETAGALNDGNRGIVEYNDLLKRPLDAWKYLLVATEQAHASLDHVSLFLDAVLLATSNELHLDAFKQHPDWPSFKGRFEFMKAPYLLRASDEEEIYHAHLQTSLRGMHVAPHTLKMLARFSVLTRLEPPDSERYSADVRALVESLQPIDKLRLYDDGAVPERLNNKDKRELRQLAESLAGERSKEDDYEGRHGASAREMRVVLLNATQDRRFDHLSPIAVLDELRRLVGERSSYEWLRRTPVRGYYDASAFLAQVEELFLAELEQEVRQALGLLKPGSQQELFERYLRHVSAWTKHEKILDQTTNRLQDPDAELMDSVERLLVVEGETPDDFRRALISQIGAQRLEQPDGPVDYARLFAGHLRKLDDAFFEQRHEATTRTQKLYLQFLSGESVGDAREREQVQALHTGMLARGYTQASAQAVVAWLLSRRQTGRASGDLSMRESS